MTLLSMDPRRGSLLWNISVAVASVVCSVWIGHSRNGLHHNIDIPDSWSGRCVLLAIFPGTGMGFAELCTCCVCCVHTLCLLCGISILNNEMIGSNSGGGW